MKACEIKSGIHWVGGIDWELRDFHGYQTRRGSTYNAYLITDEKTVLVDTVKHYLADEMLARIKTVTEPSKIDYIVSNHVEMDHSGALPKIMKLCPNATVITSPNGEKGLKKHYGEAWPFKVVNTGDEVSIGARTLRFVLMPMVHWPDSMATYVPEEKLLLPNDAFGQHIASSERFDDELGEGIVMEEAAKYYANIVLPFGAQVLKALEAISALEIDMIGPSHGVIWRKHIPEIIEKYHKWANNTTNHKAVIVFDTMWESTGKMAGAISDAFEDKGVAARVMDLKTSHISDVMTEVMEAEYVCVGSPTLNNGMLPTVAAFLAYMIGLSPKKRTGLAFGSYGWGGQSVGQIDEILRTSGFTMLEAEKIQYIPKEKDLEVLKEKVKGGIS